MELLTILLSGLLGFLSPAGVALDRVAQNAIRSRFDKVEQLQVRVDNAPSYQLVRGQVERVRIAGRGLWLTPDVRIAALEVETDPLDVDLQRLRQGGRGSLEALRQPLQAGIRLVLTEEDINKLLQSPAVMARLQDNVAPRLSNLSGDGKPYEIVNPRIEFLENNRLRLQVELRQQDGVTGDRNSPRQLALKLETGLGIVSGRQLRFISPDVSIDGNPFPALFLTPLIESISQQFDLRKLEASGITARLLKLEVNPEQLEIAAFVRVAPSSTARTDKN